MNKVSRFFESFIAAVLGALIMYALCSAGGGSQNMIEFEKIIVNEETDASGIAMFVDDIAGINRVRVVNTDSGNSSFAGISTINDTYVPPGAVPIEGNQQAVNYGVALGIASSTNDLEGGLGPNSGALAVISPADFGFLHYFDDDFVWKCNPSDTGMLCDTEEIMRLDCDGNLTITGALHGDSFGGCLSEIKQFDLSRTGAVTKEDLQAAGWAICDGTTPASQGISDPIITTTPDLGHLFLRMSDDDTSGDTGGVDTNSFSWTSDSVDDNGVNVVAMIEGTSAGTKNFDNKPPFYELVPFIKVK